MPIQLSLSQLQVSQLVRRSEDIEPAYLFRHGLIQETAYDSLLKTQRRQLHQRVALAIEQLAGASQDEFSDILAYQWEHADVPERARPHLLRAAAKAANRFANTEALELYARALAMAKEASLEELLAIHMGRAQVYEFLSQYPLALENYQACLRFARQAERKNDECQILSRMAWLHWLAGHSREAIQIAQEAEEKASRLENSGVALRAFLVAGLVAQAEGRIADAYPRLRKALLSSRKNKDRTLEGESLFYLGIQNNFMGRFGRASACAHKAYAIKSELGDPVGAMVSMYLQARALAGSGDYDAALTALERGKEIADETRNPFGLAQYPNTRAWLAAELGDWETAYEIDKWGLEIARGAPVRPPEISTLINLVLDCTATGRLAEADEYVLQVERWIGRAEFGFHAWRWQIRLLDARARLLIACSLHDEARQVVQNLIEWAVRTRSDKYRAKSHLLRAQIHTETGEWNNAAGDLALARGIADGMHYLPSRLYARRQLRRIAVRNHDTSLAERMEQEAVMICAAVNSCLRHPDLRSSFVRGLAKDGG